MSPLSGKFLASIKKLVKANKKRTRFYFLKRLADARQVMLEKNYIVKGRRRPKGRNVKDKRHSHR